jgi:hypothetical protein
MLDLGLEVAPQFRLLILHPFIAIYQLLTRLQKLIIGLQFLVSLTSFSN